MRKSKSCFCIIPGALLWGLCGAVLLHAELQPIIESDASPPTWKLSGSLRASTNTPLMSATTGQTPFKHLLNPTELFAPTKGSIKPSVQEQRAIQTFMAIDMDVLSSRQDDAMRSLRSLLIESPHHPGLIERHARVAMMDGAPRRANAYWEILTNLYPNRGDWLVEQAWCLIQSSEWLQAREKLDRASGDTLGQTRRLLLQNVYRAKLGQPFLVNDSTTERASSSSGPLNLHQQLFLGEQLIHDQDLLTDLLGPYQFRRLCAWVLHGGGVDVSPGARVQNAALEADLWTLGSTTDSAEALEARSANVATLRNWHALLKASNFHLRKLLLEMRAGRYAAALDRVRVLEQLSVESNYLQLYKMELYLKSQRLEEWNETYEKLIIQAASMEMMYPEVGRQLILQYRLEEAESLLRQGAFQHRNNAIIRFYLGGCLALQGNREGAEDQVRWLILYHRQVFAVWMVGSEPLHAALRALPSVRNLYGFAPGS